MFGVWSGLFNDGSVLLSLSLFFNISGETLLVVALNFTKLLNALQLLTEGLEYRGALRSFRVQYVYVKT